MTILTTLLSQWRNAKKAFRKARRLPEPRQLDPKLGIGSRARIPKPKELPGEAAPSQNTMTRHWEVTRWR